MKLLTFPLEALFELLLFELLLLDPCYYCSILCCYCWNPCCSLAAARSTAAAALIITRAKTPQPALDGVDVTECLLAPLGVGRQDAKSSTIGIGVDRAGGEKEAEDCDGKFLGSNEHGGQSLF